MKRHKNDFDINTIFKYTYMALKEEKVTAVNILEKGIYSALETYSNVHRGSGHYSIVTTHIYDQARKRVLDYLNLNKKKYVVVFCNAHRANFFKDLLKKGDYVILTSKNKGLLLGIVAIAIRKKVLPIGIPFETGGGTANLISTDWVLWNRTPELYEAGTPPVVNIIAFTLALSLIKKYGNDVFQNKEYDTVSISDILQKDELKNISGKDLIHELRKLLIGGGRTVPTVENEKDFVNLDYSASTPTFVPIWNTFKNCMRMEDQDQVKIISEVKSICSDFLGYSQENYDIIFTTNTTEAINIAAISISKEYKNSPDSVILNTFLEHSSNDLPWRFVPNSSLIRISVDKNGYIDINELENKLKEYNTDKKKDKKRIRIVAVSGASNVLGTCNNLSEISDMVHAYDAHLLVDAAQLVAHRKIDIEKSGIDYLAFSAHKIYAPFGSGALIVKKGLLRFDTEQLNQIKQSGEDNVAGIAALGKSLNLLKRIGMDIVHEEEMQLTKLLINEMSQIPEIKIHGIESSDIEIFADRIGVVSFQFDNIMANSIAKRLTMYGGIGLRYGCHCAHITVKRILNVGPKLEKFQKIMISLFPKLQLPGIARVSVGLGNTGNDVNRLIDELKKISKSFSNDNKNISTISKGEYQKQMNTFISDTTHKIYSY